MAVIHEVFEIPSELMARVFNGDYKIKSFIVKRGDESHREQIIGRIKPVAVRAGGHVRGAGTRAVGFARNNKHMLLLGAVACGAAAVGLTAYRKIKLRESEDAAAFRTALSTYIAAMRKDRLTPEVVEALMTALEDLVYEDSSLLNNELAYEDFDIIVGEITDFTEEFAAENGVELKDDELDRTDNIALDLWNCLDTQTRIFEAVRDAEAEEEMEEKQAGEAEETIDAEETAEEEAAAEETDADNDERIDIFADKDADTDENPEA